jgi:thiamine biosynthesis lipoprotein
MKLAWAAMGTVLLAACSREPEQVILDGKTMGTTWNLTLVKNADVREAVQHRLDELDLAFTNWRDSPVTRFNASRSTDWQSVPLELAEMVLFARELSEKTGGAFDVTLAPVVDLWGFGAKGRVKEVPTDESISNAIKHVDWRKLEARTEPPALRKLDPEIAINVSAMADGFACDDIARLLRARDIKDFLVEIGGAVFGSGVNALNQPWHAGIQRPHAETGESVKVVALHNQALSTSGVYLQYFKSDGKRYAHVLDARTGRPIAHDVVSVSVIHESAFAADGWDTALLILGPEAGRALANKVGIEALFLAESH